MTSRKANDEGRKQEPLQVMKMSAAETDERALARTMLRPSVNNAITLANVLRCDHGDLGLNELSEELAVQCAAVSDGSMARPEALLVAQAHTLDALFNHLTRLAYNNWNSLDVAERLLRLALKAQTQSRATVETVGNLKNPPTFIAQQANIAHGPQQVNNGPSPRAGETESTPSRLLEQTNGERLDTGAASEAIGSDPAMATVGAKYRAKDACREAEVCTQRLSRRATGILQGVDETG